MISLSASGGSVVFTFTNSTYYLYGDGTITVPLNSLSLVTDNSNIATFKKAATNDIFVAAPVAEFGMSKAEIEAFYKENMVGSTGGGGGGGVTSGEVETMIDESISGKADTSAVTAVNDVLTAHTANTTIHVTAAEKSTWNAKSDFSGSYNDLTDKPTIPTVPTSNTAFTNDAGYATSGYVDSAVSGKQDTLVSGTNIKTINNESLLGSGNITISGGGSGTAAVEVTQAEYDLMVSGGTVDPTVFYIITDAPAVDMSEYVTTNTVQDITAQKIFVGDPQNKKKSIKFKQYDNASKVGFIISNSAETNNELASFELKPDTFTIDGVQHPLLYFGHYRNNNTANAGVQQTVLGFRQYDQPNAAAYHYLMPLPEKAKTPFSLTTSFKDYYAPMGFKNGSTMITADNTGVVDLSSELGGLKLVKLTQQEYDALTTKDSNSLYIING